MYHYMVLVTKKCIVFVNLGVRQLWLLLWREVENSLRTGVKTHSHKEISPYAVSLRHGVNLNSHLKTRLPNSLRPLNQALLSAPKLPSLRLEPTASAKQFQPFNH